MMLLRCCRHGSFEEPEKLLDIRSRKATAGRVRAWEARLVPIASLSRTGPMQHDFLATQA